MYKKFNPALVATGLLSLYLLLFITHSLVKMGIPVLNLSFGDLRLVTSSASCALNGVNWSVVSPSCDPWGRPFNLPSLWVKIFSFLGFTEDKTFLIGIIMIVLLTTTLSYWFHNLALWLAVSKIKKIMILVCFGMLLISPPLLLLAERANVDIFVFAGLTLVYFLWQKNYRYVVVYLILTLGLLKIFPWAGLVITIRMKKAKRLVLLSITGLLVGIIYLSPELINIRYLSSTGFNVISFGSSMIPDFFYQAATGETGGSVSHLLGLSVFLVTFIVIMRGYFEVVEKLRRRIEHHLKSNEKSENALLFFGSIFSFTYILGSNYDYRLVFLIPVLVALFTSDLTPKELCIGFFFAIVLFYNSFLFRAEIGLISDLLLLVFVPFLCVLLVDIFRRDLIGVFATFSNVKKNE